MQLLPYRDSGVLSDTYSNKGVDMRKHLCQRAPYRSTQACEDYSSGQKFQDHCKKLIKQF